MITDMYVSDIASAIFTSTNNADAGRASYLRTLIEATHDELSSKKGEPVNSQLAALKRVHERFYALILKTAQGFVPKTQKDRSTALHARANFARTALGAVRGHIRAGQDIVALNPAKATKASLARPEPKVTAITAKRWGARAETQSKALLETLGGLAKADKAAGIDGIQTLISQLTKQMFKLGVVATVNPEEATRENRPLRAGKAIFIPTKVLPKLDGTHA